MDSQKHARTILLRPTGASMCFRSQLNSVCGNSKLCGGCRTALAYDSYCHSWRRHWNRIVQQIFTGHFFQTNEHPQSALSASFTIFKEERWWVPRNTSLLCPHADCPRLPPLSDYIKLTKCYRCDDLRADDLDWLRH